jgi:hypothetical protein
MANKFNAHFQYFHIDFNTSDQKIKFVYPSKEILLFFIDIDKMGLLTSFLAEEASRQKVEIPKIAPVVNTVNQRHLRQASQIYAKQ